MQQPKLPVNAGLKLLKVVGGGKDGGGKGALVSRSRRDKRLSDCVYSI